MGRASRWLSTLLVVCAALFPSAVTGLGSPPPQSRVFRSGTQVVPIDVRVLDRAGNPVMDLKAEDFTILEDNAPQTLQHFFAHTLSAEVMGARATLLRDDRVGEPAPQNRRVFLFVFGRSDFTQGGFQATSKTLDAALRFVRERLLPQDQLAVIAYNRASDFTTDHARIATVIERFKTRYEWIDALISQYFQNLTAVYAGPKLPEYLQRDIDAIFAGSTSLGVRELAEGRKIVDDRRVVEDLHAALAGQARGDAVGPDAAGTVDATSRRVAEITGLSELQYAEASLQTSQDLGRIFTGINYLRHVGGEKHLVFFTPQGIYLPSLEADQSVAAAASDARVAIDTVQTGGHPSPNFGKKPVTKVGQFSLQRADRDRIETLQNLAELTGGQASIFSYGEKAMDRIARATSSGYLLGYKPTNPTWEGRYRRIVVKVRRPGLTVLHRSGYFAEPIGAPPLRRSLTYARIVEAANYGSEVRNLKVQVTAEVSKTSRRMVDVAVAIDFSGVEFSESAGLYSTTLDIAVFCGDRGRDPIGDLWQHIEAQAQQSGLSALPGERQRVFSACSDQGRTAVRQGGRLQL